MLDCFVSVRGPAFVMSSLLFQEQKQGVGFEADQLELTLVLLIWDTNDTGSSLTRYVTTLPPARILCCKLKLKQLFI